MSFKKNDYYPLVKQASDCVPGFQQAYHQFVERATIEQNSESLVTNYSRSVAQVALHFGAVPHQITADEINSYLYRISVHEGKSEGYFKQTVYGLRYWFRVFGHKEMALRMPPIKKKQTLPVVLFIRQYGEKFHQLHSPLKQHQRVLNAIVKCRTAALGGHVDQCDQCGHQRISYNSCRNRHCPKCQGTNRERWIMNRQDDLLPVPYFHVVFTLPQQLNDLCLHHPAALYNMLFQASKQTIMQLGHDQKHLGAKMGLISVLHTWGQNLSLHPHVHCIVPGGGISRAGYWKFTRSKGKFLFPGKVLSTVFRGKFMEKLKNFCSQEKIQLSSAFINALYKFDWVVDARQPFLGPLQVIEYLGRYTMALEACEFLRRFCLHIPSSRIYEDSALRFAGQPK
jgi:hypothetical protein